MSATEQRAVTVTALLAVAALVAFMTINLRGDIWFAMELRIVQLLALVQVGIAIAVSTVVFQTLTANRILTPSIMGMDALYILLQTVLVFVLGAIGLASLPATGKFALEAAAMVALSLILFLPILRRRSDLTLLLLIGVVLSVLFRSGNALLVRIMDPNDFAVAQGLSVANFSSVDPVLVLPALIATLAVSVYVFTRRHLLDIIALGPDQAVTLGVDWRREAAILLALIGLLVALSTALVGPVAFLGLLVVAAADALSGARRHGPFLLLSASLAIAVLVGGQTALQHGFSNALPLGVIIEFFGGIAFLLILFKRLGS
jgi:iron complex transport system permease protein